MRGPISPRPRQYLLLLVFLIVIPVGLKWYLIVILDALYILGFLDDYLRYYSIFNYLVQT